MKLLPARWFTRERLRPSVFLAVALVATAAGLALYFTVAPATRSRPSGSGGSARLLASAGQMRTASWRSVRGPV